MGASCIRVLGVQSLKIADLIGGVQTAATRIFPEREFLHYKNSVGMQVLRVSTRAQVLGAIGAAALTAYVGLGTVSLAQQATVEIHAESEIAESEAEVAAMRAEVAALKSDVETAALRLEQRQQFLAALIAGDADVGELAEMMPKTESAPTESASLLEPFAEMEAEQFAFVSQATTAAEARFRDAQATLDKLGLQPQRFIQQSAIAMGGPEVPADAEGGPLENAEPQFKQLFMSWKKLDLLEKGMAAVPSFKPVKSYTYTSSFGVRLDPFKGTTAMHQGVDMAGPVGETVYAAADGDVIRAGRFGGYGNFIEIDHGKGITTRYAHLSRIGVKKGDRVARGEKIAGMGSTGRSTGSHLHYEVRIDGKAVNPMPFLEASNYVMAAQDRSVETGQGGPEVAAN